MTQQFAFATVAGEGSKIDSMAGRMDGVSLISEGPALGHGLFVDEKSLQTTLAALGDKLKSYITHRGALFEDRMGREIGYFENFRVEDDQLKADFQSFDSFMEDEPRRFNRLFELAEKMPDQFGLSIVFSADRVWATEDGDIPFMLEDELPEGARFEFPSIRTEEVTSGDFVDSPAANQRGLFSQIDNNPNSNMATLTKIELTEKVDALESEKTTLSERVTELESKVETFDTLQSERDQLSADLDTTKATLSEKETALSEAETKLTEKTEAFDVLTSGKSDVDGKLSAAEAEVIRLKALVDGEEFRGPGGSDDDDYKPGKEAREKRIKEFAKENGIEEYQAVIRLSRIEPNLFKK